MAIREKQDGEDKVLEAYDRSFGSGAAVELLRLKGDGSGKVLTPTMHDNALWNKDAADGAAGTATAEHAFYVAPAAITVKYVKYIPDATLTSNDTTYATITVSKRSASGGSQTTLATVTTKTAPSGGSGDWAAWTPVVIPLSVASLAIGEMLTITITKASTGVVVPAGQLVVDFIWS